jgi:hypothetical protein
LNWRLNRSASLETFSKVSPAEQLRSRKKALTVEDLAELFGSCHSNSPQGSGGRSHSIFPCANIDPIRPSSDCKLAGDEESKVVQELLRHANSRFTLDLYAQAGMPNKRLAQSKLVRMVLNKGEALA